MTAAQKVVNAFWNIAVCFLVLALILAVGIAIQGGFIPGSYHNDTMWSLQLEICVKTAACLVTVAIAIDFIRTLNK